MELEAPTSIELKIPSVLGYEEIVMSAAEKIAQKMGFATDRIEDLKTAVSEACTNAIEHGNKLQKSSTVLISFYTENSKLIVDICDEGKSNKIPDTPNCPDISEKFRPIISKRGWGIYLIKNLMDDVSFINQDNRGTQVRMVIDLQKGKGITVNES